MSQEYNTVPSRKPRRSRNRNRPVLVTNSESALSPELSHDSEILDEAAEQVSTTHTNTLTEDRDEVPAAPLVAKAQRPSRLPNFFSKVDRSEPNAEAKEADVVKARLARATHNRAAAPTGKTPAVAETSQVASKTTKTTAKTGAQPAAPPKLFKTRHFIGMAVYLLGAQFVMPFERIFAIQLGIEKAIIPPFSFLGGKAEITTSFLFNIATLIILLYALIKLDLLPNSLIGGAQMRARQAAQSRSGQNNTVKEPPLVMKQGVKGEDDALYQAYRTNQRRDKKR